MSESNEVYLAVDLGASSGRVIAGRYDGNTMSLEEIHRFPNNPQEIDGTYRWDIKGLFNHVKEGLKKAGDQYGDAIVSLGIDTWGVDYGLLDADGALVDEPYAYRDPRTDGMMEEVFQHISKREVYDITGIQFMFFNSLLQLMSEVATNRPELHQAQRLLFTPDLLNYWLTGQQANEYCISSTSQLLDATSRTWSSEILSKTGIPERLFATPIQPGTSLGGLLPAVAEETGLANAQVIAVGSHDTASAVAAVPSDQPDFAYLSSGTWSLLGIESPEPVLNDKTFNYEFTNEGGVNQTIRLLKNLTGLWLIQECQRIWAEQGDDLSFEALVKEAEAATPFQHFVDPDDASMANPCDMPKRIRAYCEKTGQALPETKGAIIRTALDSLAFKVRTVFNMLEDLAGKRLEVLHIMGGGIQNKLLNQLTANAIQRKVVAGPIEATAAGNVLVQMMAAGKVESLQAGRALVKRSFDPEIYEPQDAEETEAAYLRFLEVTSS